MEWPQGIPNQLAWQIEFPRKVVQLALERGSQRGAALQDVDLAPDLLRRGAVYDKFNVAEDSRYKRYHTAGSERHD